MTQAELNAQAKKALIKIADTLEDISQKLDYIIKKQTEDFFFADELRRRRAE